MGIKQHRSCARHTTTGEAVHRCPQAIREARVLSNWLLLPPALGQMLASSARPYWWVAWPAGEVGTRHRNFKAGLALALNATLGSGSAM